MCMHHAFTHVPVGEVQGCASADLMMPRGKRYNNNNGRRGLLVGVQTGYPLRRSISPILPLPPSSLHEVSLSRLLSVDCFGLSSCSVSLLYA